ncbi:MAG: sulfatase-like hydrolase/transferase [Bacteroidetes bacterium]|nr:sulfatase-like hydrolase/transferase [Bacteroidota bacterium]
MADSLTPACRAVVFAVTALLVLMLSAQGAVADEESTRPNIVVFVADDAGWDDSSVYGNPRVRTPNIQRLADTGMTFSRAFVTSPQCSPSRASMLTGLYPHQTGAEDLHEPIPAEVTILPAYLQETGYFTGSMLKQHIGRAASRQFDWYSARLGRFEVFLDRRGERPFFLWVGFMDPHRPYLRGTIAEPHDPADVRVPAHLADTPETRREIARYYDEISRMDGWIGRFLDTLKARGLRENTIVIYLSDNGWPFPRAKGSLYDAGMRTPYIWSWPRVVEPGTRREGVASTIDLAPTLLDAAGAEIPADMEGESILAVLAGTESAGARGREAAFSQRNWHGSDDHIRAVRTERFKLIINAYETQPFGLPPDIAQSDTWKSLLARREEGRLNPQQRLNFSLPRPPVEFYDLRRDPHEYTNRAWSPEYAAEQQRLFRELDEWMARTNDYPPGPEPRPDATDRITGRPLEWRHRLLLWAERFVAPWLLPLVEREP